MLGHRYIDANKIKIFGVLERDDETGEFMVSIRDVRRGIGQTPTEDVIAVVRCGACRHYAKYRKITAGNPEGWNYCYCDVYPVMRHREEYCSRGEVLQSK